MSLLTATTANYAGFGSVTAKFSTVEKVQAEDIDTDTLTATGDIVTTADVTCNTLNYVALNPPIFAYSTVATMAELVTQTIPNGDLVYCAETASVFRGLRNPQDTTILPSGTPWGVNGYLTMILLVLQGGTNNPTVLVEKNELFVGTTTNVLPTAAVRTNVGRYEVQWTPQLPYGGFVAAVTPTSNLDDSVAQQTVNYSRTGPPYSLVQIRTRDYAGNFVDMSSTSPHGVRIILNFVPRTNWVP
jgi:hypothetical protein